MTSKAGDLCLTQRVAGERRGIRQADGSLAVICMRNHYDTSNNIIDDPPSCTISIHCHNEIRTALK